MPVQTSEETLCSFERRQGVDGVTELHVYEHPLRPYRAYVADASQPVHRPVQLPGTGR